jgi:hypothetical protein
MSFFITETFSRKVKYYIFYTKFWLDLLKGPTSGIEDKIDRSRYQKLRLKGPSLSF